MLYLSLSCIVLNLHFGISLLTVIMTILMDKETMLFLSEIIIGMSQIVCNVKQNVVDVLGITT